MLVLVKIEKILLHCRHIKINEEYIVKKTPILLSTLMVAAGISGVVSTALAATSPVYATEVAAAEDTQTTDIYVEDLYAMSDYFRISELDFAKNRIVFSVGGNHALDGIRPQRAMIVVRDYESGVSEAEADQRAHTLGVGDDTWYRTFLDTRTVSANNYMSGSGYQLRENLSDILYFALQFGEIITDASGKKTLENVYWVRGKIDYRKCIHSELFDAETMVCTVKVNRLAQTAMLAAISDGDWLLFPEDEKVMTWEEEWRKVLAVKIANLNTQLTHMKEQLPVVGATLDQMAATIKKLQTASAEVDPKQELSPSFTELQVLLQQVQSAYDWMLGTEQEKVMTGLRDDLQTALLEIERLKQSTGGSNEQLEKLQIEIQTLQAKLDEASAQFEAEVVKTTAVREELQQILAEKEEIMQKVQELTMKNSELRQVNNDLTAENEALKKQNQDLLVQNEVLNARIRDLEAALAEKPICTLITEVQMENTSTDVEIMPENTSKKTNAIEDVATEEVVEVPNLGEVETKTNFWWVVVAIVGALGVLGMCCKKRLGRD